MTKRESNRMDSKNTQKENVEFKKGEQVEEKRMKWLHKAAKAGNKRAQYRLGLCYYYGRWGIEKDESLGIAWLKEAAKAGQRKAIKLLMEILPYNDPYLYELHKKYGDPAEAERLLDIHERML